MGLVEHERPDLVIHDVSIPWMNQFEEVRGVGTISDVPVIMLTAKSGTLTLDVATQQVRLGRHFILLTATGNQLLYPLIRDAGGER